MLKIKWDKNALIELYNAYKHIKSDSLKNAQIVKSDILAITKSLSTYPERYPLDKNKENNDGSYRAFEKHNYRIAYRVLNDHIRILRVRHSKQEPKTH